MKKFLLTYLLSLIVTLGYSTQYEYNVSAPTIRTYDGSPLKAGQTFLVGGVGADESFVIDSISIYISMAINYNVYVEIYALSGGLPSGSPISTGTISSANVPSPSSWVNCEVTSVALSASTSYALVFYSTEEYYDPPTYDLFNVGVTLSNNYTYGNMVSYSGGVWGSDVVDQDMLFRVYGKHAPIITSQPTSITRCAGTSATFSVVVDSYAPTYQWRKGGSNISGATGSSYTISSVVSGSAGNYDCVVTESLLGTTTTSSTATLTVPTTTSITSHPSSISRCVGIGATFSVTAVGSGLTYQWKKNGSNISGATSTGYTISSVATGDAANYTVTVTGTCGTVTSSAAILTVNTPPTITDHPDNLSLCIGDNATFSVTATGTGLTYQWMKDEVSISGATSSSYTILGVDNTDAGAYHCIVHGTCAMSTSNDATLTLGTSTLLNNLVSYYGFNGTGTYTTEVDEHGVNDGTVTNVTRTGSEAVRLSYGFFDSNTDYITLTSAITQTTGSYSFWLYPTDRSDDRLVMGNNVYYSRIYLTINGYVRIETNTNNQEFVFSSNAVPLNTWSNVTLTRLGDVMKYYLNGTYIESVTVASAAALTLSQIGFNGRSFSGRIDEVGIWSRELNSDEVLELYNTGLGIVYSTMGDCGGAPPEEPATGRKKILLAGKFRNIVLSDIERDFGKAIPTTPTDYLYLSHNQYMVTYDGAENNDIVGTFDPWFVTDYTSSDAYSYSLTDNEGGIYAINSSSGVVTVADNTSMASGTDTITVAVTLGSITESYKAYITVRAEANCHFIDNTQPTNGTGSRASPYNTWSGITFQAGHAYFQKRGTTYSANINANVNGSAGNEIIYAAYGTGNKPRITNVVANNGLTIRANYIWVFEFYFGSNLTGIRTPGNVDLYQYCRISDCEFNSNATSGDGQLYFQKYGTPGQYNWYHEVYDCKAYNTGGTGEQYGIKIEGSAVKVRNFHGYNNRSQAISIPMWGYRDTLSGVLGYNNGKHQVELSGRYHELSQSYLSGGIGSVAIMDTGSYFTTIRNNTMIGGTYKGAIAITCNTGGISYGGTFTIQDNIIHDVTTARAGIYVAWNVVDVTIRRNKIYNCTNGVEIGEYGVGLSNIKLHYNLLYNNTTDISGLSGSNIYVYNNTCDGAINLTGTTSYVYNTLYRTLTGYTVQSNNLDLDAISIGDYFRDYVARDYHLKSTASLCINQGISNGLTRDIIGTPINGLPDIGAYEYIP